MGHLGYGEIENEIDNLAKTNRPRSVLSAPSAYDSE